MDEVSAEESNLPMMITYNARHECAPLSHRMCVFRLAVLASSRILFLLFNTGPLEVCVCVCVCVFVRVYDCWLWFCLFVVVFIPICCYLIILKITVTSLLLKDFKLRTEETDTERAGIKRDREIGQ